MQNRRLLKRRVVTGLSLLGLFLLTVALNPKSYNYTPVHSEPQSESIKPDGPGGVSKTIQTNLVLLTPRMAPTPLILSR